jgi:hypothetical protein
MVAEQERIYAELLASPQAESRRHPGRCFSEIGSQVQRRTTAASSRRIRSSRCVVGSVLPLLALALAPAVRAQSSVDDELRKQMEWMRKQMEQMAQEIKDLKAQVKAGNAQPSADEYYIPRIAMEFEQSGQSAQLGNVYTKPFLTNLGSRTYVGGYVNLESRTTAREQRRRPSTRALHAYISRTSRTA